MTDQSFSELSFSELQVQPEILRATEFLNFEKMTPIQAQAIPLLLEGKDVIGQAQTGTGKTAAFGIPILNRIDPENKNVQAIILCPTRELAVQAAKEIRNFAMYMHDIKVLPIYGGQDIMIQIRGLKGVQVVVGTPGRIMDHMRRHTIKMSDISMVVLDEADEMLNMGFREDMEVILGAIEHPHQTCLFSATMPQEILDITSLYQKEPVLIQVSRDELTVNRIDQFYYSVKREYKLQALTRLLAYHRYHKCMIFCNKKSTVDELVTELQKEGYAAEGLHGDLSQQLRDKVMGRFRERDHSILIATDIAARGIDVENVEAVFNYDVPLESEYYVHRIGRTGRAGHNGVSHTLCSSKEFRKIRFIEKDCNTTMTEKAIPSPDDINQAKENYVYEKVLAKLQEGSSEKLIPSIRQFCEEKEIRAEALAAAFLRLELGDELEELEIDLPSREEQKRSRRSSRNDRFGHYAFFERYYEENPDEMRSEEKGERKRGRRHEDRDDRRRSRRDDRNKRGEDRRDDRNKRGEDRGDDRNPRRGERRSDPIRRFETAVEKRFEQYREDHERKHSAEREARPFRDKSYPDRSDRQKNRERSRKVLDRAAKDLRMDGRPKKKHR